MFMKIGLQKVYCAVSVWLKIEENPTSGFWDNRKLILYYEQNSSRFLGLFDKVGIDKRQLPLPFENNIVNLWKWGNCELCFLQKFVQIINQVGEYFKVQEERELLLFLFYWRGFIEIISHFSFFNTKLIVSEVW